MKSVSRHLLLSAAPRQILAFGRRPAPRRRYSCLIMLFLCTGLSCFAGSQAGKESEQRKIQSIIRSYGARLGIAVQVAVVLVPQNSRLVSVEYAPGRTDLFQISFKEGFLATLDDGELHAAIAHEMGHIWIYTHFPFLQTEILANQQARKLVERRELARMYQKVWAWNGESGDLSGVLGTDEDDGGQSKSPRLTAAHERAPSRGGSIPLHQEGPLVYVEGAPERRSATALTGAGKAGNASAVSPEIADSLAAGCPECIFGGDKAHADYVINLRPGPPRTGHTTWFWSVRSKSGALLDKGAAPDVRHCAEQAFRTLMMHWRSTRRREIHS